jgi:hypothetical protein
MHQTAVARSLEPDRVGVYCILEQIVIEPADGDPQRVQLWGVFMFADGEHSEGYGAVQRGYMYYACPSGQTKTCQNDWADFQWAAGTEKGLGYGLRTMPTGRLRKANDPPASPDPYPVQGGVAKMESKDPSQSGLVARLKEALGK